MIGHVFGETMIPVITKKRFVTNEYRYAAEVGLVNMHALTSFDVLRKGVWHPSSPEY